MKTNFLFPHYFKKWAISVFVLTFIFNIYRAVSGFSFPALTLKTFGIISIDESPESSSAAYIIKYFRWTTNNLTDELTFTLLIISGILLCFSKEKIEDEMIGKIRLESLLWATYLNYGLLLLGILFVFGLPFLQVLYFNVFALLFFFIFLYHWKLYKHYKTISNEE